LIVVFDSGVWISALNFGRSPLQAVEHARIHDEIATCDQIVAEVRKALLGKFDWHENEVERELSQYLTGAIVIDNIGALQGVCRDPKDDIILECAAVAGAEVLITGDRDLLVIGSYQGVRILTVREYLDTLTSAAL
jgi:putative PIN family toxin of toxin-antitoxin system